MSFGTHVGIIGNEAHPGPMLTAEIQRTLKRISDARPFPPLVLHHAHGRGASIVAQEYVRTAGGWQIERKLESAAGIAEACHILIVIAAGKENSPVAQTSSNWTLVKKARDSGRTIIHIPVIDEPSKSRGKASAAPARSLEWARGRAQADAKIGKVYPKYTSFRQAHGLPDSPESLKLWQAYKKAAGMSSQKGGGVVPSARSSGGGKTRRRRLIIIPEAPRPRSRPDPSGAVPLRSPTDMHGINPPDPDVWR